MDPDLGDSAGGREPEYGFRSLDGSRRLKIWRRCARSSEQEAQPDSEADHHYDADGDCSAHIAAPGSRRGPAHLSGRRAWLCRDWWRSGNLRVVLDCLAYDHGDPPIACCGMLTLRG